MRVVRPIVRSFKAPYTRECAEHVRGGGHGVLWETPRRARLVIPVPDADDPMDLGLWSVLDLGKWRWQEEMKGALRALATSVVPRDCHDIVRRRAERDAVFAGTRRAMNLDCLSCGACCLANRVELEDVDISRFADAGRGELAQSPYAKRVDGKVILRLTRSRRCRHLHEDNRCGIYAIRPNACSQFPVGSECCLSAREEEFGMIDS